ncbi:MAG TPA: hypothetical protein VFZ83_04295 [Acidimicrobiia bacterium]|nr:hypothetical protein [Acidimicrobiia bacterium]
MDGTPDDLIPTSEGRAARVDVSDREAGLTTAELLGNAALGVLALVAIWTALRGVGLDVVDWVRAQLVQ